MEMHDLAKWSCWGLMILSGIVGRMLGKMSEVGRAVGTPLPKTVSDLYPLLAFAFLTGIVTLAALKWHRRALLRRIAIVVNALAIVAAVLVLYRVLGSPSGSLLDIVPVVVVIAAVIQAMGVWDQPASI